MKGKNQRIIDEFGDLSFPQLRGLVLYKMKVFFFYFFKKLFFIYFF